MKGTTCIFPSVSPCSPLAKGGDGEGLIGWLRVKNEERKKEGKKERGEGRIARGGGTLQ